MVLSLEEIPIIHFLCRRNLTHSMDVPLIIWYETGSIKSCDTVLTGIVISPHPSMTRRPPRCALRPVPPPRPRGGPRRLCHAKAHACWGHVSSIGPSGSPTDAPSDTTPQKHARPMGVRPPCQYRPRLPFLRPTCTPTAIVLPHVPQQHDVCR